MGRIIVASECRTGLGKKLTSEAISRIADEYPNTAIRICAQLYLEKFYLEFGF